MTGERKQFACCLWISALALAMHSALPPPARANRTAARDVLAKQHELVEQRGHWVLPLELEMRREFAALPKKQQELQRARVAAEETQRIVVERNHQVEQAIAALRIRIRAAEAKTDLGAVQREILTEQLRRDRADLEALQQAWIDPINFGEHQPLKRQIIRYCNQRNELAVSILKIHEQREVLTQRYEVLAQDRQVRAALHTLGHGQRLGPLADYQAKSFLAKLAEYERDVFTAELPLYRAGGDLRVSALIGRTPVTFTWRESSEPTMLTASVIEATGLEVPPDAATLQLRLPDGSDVTVREFAVPYVRFGNQLLRNVRAYALPPEAENVGTQIGPTAFEGLSPRAEPQNLRLVLN